MVQQTYSLRPKARIIRMTTAAVTMNIVLKGQLSYLSREFDITGITSYDPKHFEEIRSREKISLMAVEMERTISPLKDLKSLWQLFSIFRKDKPHIVHTHTPKAGLLGMLAAYLAGVEIKIHTVGGIPWMEVKGAKRGLLKAMEKLTYACADRIYPNSKGLMQFIINEKICPLSKLKVLGNGGSNGINTSHFTRNENDRQRLRAQYNIGDDEMLLGFVGRIAREKGITEWLEAFDLLRQKYKVKILLVGLFEKTYGGLSEETEDRILNDPYIVYPGRADDVRPFYAMMDIFVFPSYREGFPNAVLEACAMELPVIATDINGCNEIIEDKVSGLLIPPKSSSAIENAVSLLIDRPEMRKALAMSARAAVVEKFSNEIVWNAVREEYQILLEEIQK
ncbi:MAG: glycosyltransferase family 4 protein [Saprospiraceae bacterium]|nr:glycosyltransferase family 4 protein [Saprospiraceae bacterium]